MRNTILSVVLAMASVACGAPDVVEIYSVNIVANSAHYAECVAHEGYLGVADCVDAGPDYLDIEILLNGELIASCDPIADEGCTVTTMLIDFLP